MQDINVSIIIFAGDEVEIVPVANNFPHELIFDPGEYLLEVSRVDVVFLAVRDNYLFKVVRDFHREFRPLFQVGYCSDFKVIVDIENVDLRYMSTFAGYDTIVLAVGALIRVDDNIVDRLIRIQFYLIVLDQPPSFNVEYQDFGRG